MTSRLDEIIDEFLMTGKSKEAFQLLRRGVDINGMVRRSQSEVLRKLQGEPERKDNLAPLIWSVKEYSPGTFVLGDLGPVARFSDSKDLQPPIKGGSSLVSILLPVTSQHLRVGKMQGDTATIDPDALNIAFVELSRDFFIANRNTDRERKYFLKLGRRSSLLDEKEMQRLLKGPH
jgi:hypothetical protein